MAFASFGIREIVASYGYGFTTYSGSGENGQKAEGW